MSGNQERFQQAMNQGHSAAWDQAWDKAASFYQQALVEFPDHPKALTSLALALYELHEYDEALKNYQRAAQISPNDPVPLEKVAELLERMGRLPQATKIYMEVAEKYARNRDLDKAIENWSSVVSLTPEHIPAHSRLAIVYERLGRKQQAIMEYIAIASLMQHSGEIPKAAQTINHLLQIYPDSNEARQALNLLQTGKLLPKPRRPRGVTGPLVMAQVRQLESAKLDEDRPKVDPIQEARQVALTQLAGLLFETDTGDDDTFPHAARHGMTSIIRGTGILGQTQADQASIMLHLSQAIDMQSRKMDSEAITELERAMESGLDAPAAFFDLGLLLSSEEQLDEAIRMLQHAVKHTSFALAARLLLGRAFRKTNRAKEASIEYLEALRVADAESVSPEQAEELIQLYDPIIEASMEQSTPELQNRLCENIDQMLMRPDWRNHLKSARMQLPQQAAGASPLPLAEMLTEASSSQVVESLAKVHNLARDGKLVTAMEEAYYALNFAPTYLPLHITIGDLLLQAERIPDAVTKFSVVAESYSVRGEANRSINILKRVSALAPMNMEARNRLIDLMMERGETEETIKEFLKLAETYYSLADLAMARKTYTRALRYAQQANIDRAGKVAILHRMADIDMQSLDWRQALRVFEQIRTLEPDDEKSRSMLIDLNLRLGQAVQALGELDNYLAHMLNSGQSKKALDFLVNLVQENTKQPAMHRRLGELYRQLGRTQEAIDQLTIAGEQYLSAGNRTAAIETISAILALNPPNASDYQQLLAKINTE
jgi:tetratricopeptide (TPR) repeat protein